MKLGELRGMIRKTKGNPLATIAAAPGLTLTVAIQKTSLLEELERAFPGGKGVDTPFEFDEETNLLRSTALGAYVQDVLGTPADSSFPCEDDLLLDETPLVPADDDLLDL